MKCISVFTLFFVALLPPQFSFAQEQPAEENAAGDVLVTEIQPQDFASFSVTNINVDFGKVRVGTTKVKKIVLKNNTKYELLLQAVTPSAVANGFGIIYQLGATISPGDKLEIATSFHRTSGPYAVYKNGYTFQFGLAGTTTRKFYVANLQAKLVY